MLLNIVKNWIFRIIYLLDKARGNRQQAKVNVIGAKLTKIYFYFARDVLFLRKFFAEIIKGILIINLGNTVKNEHSKSERN